MMRRVEAGLLRFSVFVSAFSAFAAPRGRVASDMLQGRGALASSEVRPLVVVSEARAEMARYSLKAYGKRDATNVVQGRFFMSKPMGLMHRSRVPRP